PLLSRTPPVSHYTCRVMPPIVINGAQHAIFAPRHHELFTCQFRLEKVSFIPHLVRSAYDLPPPAEHTLLLQFLDLLVEIPWRRNRPRVIQGIVWVVQVQKIADISFHRELPSSGVQADGIGRASLIPRNVSREKHKRTKQGPSAVSSGALGAVGSIR